ncbi:hypothetical protein H4696_008954 [Amycolatopsis lexingtonensis]|uniref:Uncharacterized protein n=1 Tax=Amycolatopsis lexingtonensis TaxID=218822 RepID=A0ABR9IF94_9PSEU|nr:hypothetical protein [Amycolatopsis lexingtonensis]MBE1501854.1 hypothetical protein [Amycolatopsis lexingtonensis]
MFDTPLRPIIILNPAKDDYYRNATTTVSNRGWRRREPGPMPLLERPSLLPRAIELLKAETDVDELALASECQAPLSLFRMITARAPNRLEAPKRCRVGRWVRKERAES